MRTRIAIALIACLPAFSSGVCRSEDQDTGPTFSRKATEALDNLQLMQWLSESQGFEPDVWKELQAHWRAAVLPVLHEAVGRYGEPRIEIETGIESDTMQPWIHFHASLHTPVMFTIGKLIRHQVPKRSLSVDVFYGNRARADEEMDLVYDKAISAPPAGGSSLSAIGSRQRVSFGDRGVFHGTDSDDRGPETAGYLYWQRGVAFVQFTAAAADRNHDVMPLAQGADQALEAAGIYDFPRSRFAPYQPIAVAADARAFDLNPLFHPGGLRPASPDATSFEDVDFLEAEQLAEFAVERAGAAADGASKLLIRAEFPAAGSVQASVVGGDRNGTVQTLLFDETGELAGRHYAFLVYTPPPVFGEDRGKARKLQDRVQVRDVHVNITHSAEDDGSRTEVGHTLLLARPPVVLVHGTYDSAKYCWAYAGKDPVFGTESLHAQLQLRGFATFLVDYASTNGLTKGIVVRDDGPLGALGATLEYDPSGPSHFKDNESILWNGGIDKNGEPGEGIDAALGAFRRDLRLAATQVDVVAHSMGGVLSRVWIREEPLPQHDHCRELHGVIERPRLPYRRSGNFNKGDVRRLITISSTHRGSDISGLLQQYSWEDGHAANEIWNPWPPGVVWVADNQAGTRTGAFLDQVPDSPALNAIGETRVPAHAIACVAQPEQLMAADEYGELYKGRVANIRWGTPRQFMQRVFQVLGQPADGKRLKEHPDYGGEQHLLSFWAAVFGNTENDCVVRKDSSFGGLPERCGKGDACPHVQRIDHVLHGPAPRHEAVQNHVIRLLLTGFDRFEMQGFPAAGGSVRRLNRHYSAADAWQPKLPAGS